VVLHLLKKERENIRYQVELTNQVFTQIETICERQVCHGILDKKERIPYLTLRNLPIPSLALQNFFLYWTLLKLHPLYNTAIGSVSHCPENALAHLSVFRSMNKITLTYSL
jgi:hypothetical protein